MEKVEGLNSFLDDALKNNVFPGYSYSLVCKDGIFNHANGYKNTIPTNEDTSCDTLYDMASCTKVICTTTCILKLMEMGKIRLYDSVTSYLDRFKYNDITIFNLLTHTSGLPACVFHTKELKSKEELMDKLFDCNLIYETNKNIVYSDLGFILLGLIVEKVSGMGLDEFSRKYVFDPLEMYNTGFHKFNLDPNFDNTKYAATEIRNDSVVNELLRGKVHDEKAYIMGGVSGHAGLFSTSYDINHFIKMILDNGVYNGKQFLSRATLDLIFQPMVRLDKGVSLDCTQRGLGWIVKGDYCGAGDIASNETIHHTGFTGTNIFIDRINKVGFSLLTNRVHPTRDNTLILAFRSKLGNYVISHFGARNV